MKGDYVDQPTKPTNERQEPDESSGYAACPQSGLLLSWDAGSGDGDVYQIWDRSPDGGIRLIREWTTGGFPGVRD
jgi:hypothetical protein